MQSSVYPPNIKRLDHSHWPEIKELYFACEEGVTKKYQAKGAVISPSYEASQAKIWSAWSTAIQKYYLDNDQYHYLYGIWDDEKLQTILGWRCDLPEPYNNDWVIVYMKSRYEANNLSSFLSPLWRLMFEQCEQRGFTRWHAIVSKDRFTKFDAFERRYVPDIHCRYKYATTVDIPPGTRPEIEWVWAMMGRSVLRSHQEVRTGTRIND